MSNQTVQFSANAYEALLGEPVHIFKLYVSFAKDMDFSTGVVGLRRRISMQYVRERLEVSAVQGRRRTVPSNQMIRSGIDRLVALGLVSRMSRPFVFSLPLEKARLSVQNNRNTTTHPSQQEQATDFNNSYGGIPDDEHNNNNLPLTHSLSSSEKYDFCMHESWKPSELFSARASMMNFDINNKDHRLLNYALLDMRLYWQSERMGVRKSQHGWEKALLQTMLRMQAWGTLEQYETPARHLHTHKKTFHSDAGKEKIPPVPNYRDERLMQWAAKMKAPEALGGRSYAEYRMDLMEWRKKQLRINK